MIAVGRQRPVVGLATIFVMLVVTACGGVTPSNGREPMPTVDSSIASAGIVSDDGATVSRQPLSGHTLVVGVSYLYEMPRCQAQSPLDFDGAFWDPETGDDLAAVAGKKGSVVLMAPDSAVFRADDGTVVEMRRHVGVKTFKACS